MLLRRRPDSIRGRLVRALALGSLLWCSALGVAVWVAVNSEVNELLDDSLQSAAEGLSGPFALALGEGVQAESRTAAEADSGRFMWQLVSHRDGARVLSSARGAPATALQATPTPGFSNRPGWRVYGLAAGHDGQMLYVAQTRDERAEAELEIAFAVLVAGLPMALLAMLWLRGRVRHEMQPLHELAQRLEGFDPLQPGSVLGDSPHEELRPMQRAIDALAQRLAQRIAHERAFTAHAAHALRTPLAGIDAQLAVALREAPQEPLHGRLQRVRGAAERLQRVVAALLAMFRSGADVQRTPIDLPALLARLPIEGLTLDVQATHPLAADTDLLTAALLNLLDNAVRHGARTVRVTTPAPGVLQLLDDGRGVEAAQRQALQQALDAQDYAGRMGLGLMLADLVARAHGGALQLPDTTQGFAALLRLAPA